METLEQLIPDSKIYRSSIWHIVLLVTAGLAWNYWEYAQYVQYGLLLFFLFTFVVRDYHNDKTPEFLHNYRREYRFGMALTGAVLVSGWILSLCIPGHTVALGILGLFFGVMLIAAARDIEKCPHY